MVMTRYVRSRTGCWTCRFRKKKCDETRPICKQCQHLRIHCDGYEGEAPAWMKDNTAAEKKKLEIKSQIGKRGRRRRRTLTRLEKEKEKATGETGDGNGGPMELKIIWDDYNKSIRQNIEERAGNVCAADTKGVVKEEAEKGEPELEFEFEENKTVGITLLKVRGNAAAKLKTPNPKLAAMCDAANPPLGCFRSPAKNSFARFFLPSYAANESGIIVPEGSVGFAVIKSPMHYAGNVQPLPSLANPVLNSPIPCEDAHEADLVNHYLRAIFHFTFRAMSDEHTREIIREVIVPHFCSNLPFLRSCMSSSALHLTALSEKNVSQKELVADVWRYRMQSIRDLMKQIKNMENKEGICLVIFTLISFEVYSSLDGWKQHVQAAIECIVQLDYLNKPSLGICSSFVATRGVWLDIMSSLTLGRAPQLWANYRQLLSRPPEERGSVDLLEMTGCDDTVMYLISEVMCLEEYKIGTVADKTIDYERGKRRAIDLDQQLMAAGGLPCSLLSRQSVPDLASRMDALHFSSSSDNFSYPSPSTSASSRSSAGHTPSDHGCDGCDDEGDEDNTPTSPGTPQSSTHNATIPNAITAAYQITARIHLWSLGSGFFPRLAFFQRLLEELIVAIEMIPSGRSGFDRAIIWPLVVGGSMATAEKDREFFLMRCRQGEGAKEKFGTLGRVEDILKEVWKRRDGMEQKLGIGTGKEIHWREVMRDKEWEILFV